MKQMKQRRWIYFINIIIWGRLAFKYICIAVTKRRISWLIMGLLISFVPVLIVSYMMKSDQKENL